MHDNVLANLESGLRALRDAAAEKHDCRDHLARLDEIARLAGHSLSPDIRHYLQNRSYEKALLALHGSNPETTPVDSSISVVGS